MTSNLNLLTNADSNLILTGYTGPNQPAMGRTLAARLNRRLVNVDDRLEDHTGMALADIRAVYGQTRLKDLEGEVIAEILLNRGTVIRVSGDTLSRGDVLARFTETGPVICLVASLDAVLRRLHLMMGNRFHIPAERDLALGDLRRAWQVRGQPGVWEVDVTYRNEAETLEAVTSLWQELTLQRG
jgi:shikimate kinase